MTKAELDKEFEYNDRRMKACFRITNNNFFSEEIRERAAAAIEKLKKKETELEEIGRRLEINKGISILEAIEMELGIE